MRPSAPIPPRPSRLAILLAVFPIACTAVDRAMVPAVPEDPPAVHAVVSAATASAVSFSTIVVSANGPHASAFFPGDPVSVSYELDGSVGDSNAAPDAGLYFGATLSLAMDFPDLGLAVDFTGGNVQTFDNTPNPDDQVFIFGSVSQNGATLGGETITSVEMDYTGTTSMLSSDALPTSLPSDLTRITVFFGTSSGWTQLNLSVENIQTGFSCSQVTEIPEAECEALVAFHDATGGDGWVNSSGWLQTDTPCGWFGVTCSAGAVTGLNINSNNLTGALPSELTSLTSLSALQLRNNAIGGSIPAFLGGITSLVALRIDRNALTGEIPAELGNLTSLNTLGLSSNDLSGPIPAEVASIPTLYYVVLSDNGLSGTIPPEFASAAGLGLLDLSNNQLGGPIPPILGGLTGLWHLELADNQLEGPIPAELANLVSLATLQLQGNQLSGLIPFEVAQLGASIQDAYGSGRCQFAPPGNIGLFMPATADYLALGDPICGIPLTSLDDIAAAVMDEITGLVESGELVAGLGNALIQHVEKAVEKLGQGNTRVATAMINGLIQQITHLIHAGQISAEDGESLIALAMILMP